MTLSDNVVLLAQRIGAEFKTVRTETLNTISTKISDATLIGRSLLTATDAASARATLGAGTSSLALGTTSTTAAAGNDARLADARTPLAHKSTHATGGADALAAADIGAAASSHTHPSTQISDATTVGKALIVAADAATARTAIGAGTSNLALGATATTAAAGNDSRLADARTPTAHKTTHATGGTDALSPADIGAATSGHTHTLASLGAAATSHSHAIADLTATGTKDATTYLRGDGTWATVAAGTALNGPYAMLRQNTGQSITAALWQKLNWNVADLDSHTGFSATVNPSRWTVPAGQGGTYKVTGSVVATTIADGNLLVAGIYKNGVVVPNSSVVVTTGRTDSLTSLTSITLSLAAGDYLELWTYCPVAYTTRFTTDGLGSNFQVERIGAPIATSQKLTAYAEASPGTGWALWNDTSNYARMNWSLAANGMATVSGMMNFSSGTSATVCPLPSSLFTPKASSQGGLSQHLLSGAVNDVCRLFYVDPVGLVLRGALPSAGQWVMVNGTYPTTSATT